MFVFVRQLTVSSFNPRKLHEIFKFFYQFSTLTQMLNNKKSISKTRDQAPNQNTVTHYVVLFIDLFIVFLSVLVHLFTIEKMISNVPCISLLNGNYILFLNFLMFISYHHNFHLYRLILHSYACILIPFLLLLFIKRMVNLVLPLLVC
jgi:hypothetical protein